MRRFLAALLGLIVGYPAFAVIGYFAISLLSDNQHDRSVEAAVTTIFFFGPLGAIVGLVTGAIFGRPRRVSQPEPQLPSPGSRPAR
jgi:hypothetical protein